jgi:hypothetical protein
MMAKVAAEFLLPPSPVFLRFLLTRHGKGKQPEDRQRPALDFEAQLWVVAQALPAHYFSRRKWWSGATITRRKQVRMNLVIRRIGQSPPAQRRELPTVFASRPQSRFCASLEGSRQRVAQHERQGWRKPAAGRGLEIWGATDEQRK